MNKDEERATRTAQVEAIRAWFVLYGELAEIKEEFKRLHQRDNSHGESAWMLLHGPSRSGKTKLMLDYVTDHPPTEGPDGDQQEVVFLKAPSACTTKTLAEEILKALGYPRSPSNHRNGSRYSDRHPRGPRLFDMMDVMVEYIQGLGVRLMFIDEVHQAARSEQAIVDAATMFKDIINEGDCCLVLSGTEDAKVFMKSLPELRGRMLARCELKPFDWFDEHRRDTFLGLIDGMDDQLPFEQRSNLTSPDMAVRIHIASSGLIGEAAKLVENAGIIAVREDARCILPAHFAKAFQMTADDNEPNPFLEATPDPRRLEDLLREERPLLAPRRRGRRGDEDFWPR